MDRQSKWKHWKNTIVIDHYPLQILLGAHYVYTGIAQGVPLALSNKKTTVIYLPNRNLVPKHEVHHRRIKGKFRISWVFLLVE